MVKNYRGPFAAGLRAWHLGQDRAGRCGEGSLEQSVHTDGYNVVVGLGHSPAILRGSPHFQVARMVVIDALWDEGGGAQARGIRDDGTMDVSLPPVVALPRKGVADWKSGALKRSPRDRSRQGIPRSNCRLALQPGQNNRDPRQLILGALGHQYP